MREEVLRLVEKYCIGEPRYINKTNIVDDVHDELARLIRDFKKSGIDYENEESRYDFIQDNVSRIQRILFVIKDKYVYEGRGLDTRVDDLDLHIQDAVMKIAFRAVKNI